MYAPIMQKDFKTLSYLDFVSRIEIRDIFVKRKNLAERKISRLLPAFVFVVLKK